MATFFEAIIIGAGQAGLAAAHELSRRGLTPGTDFLILDSNDGPGGAWRHRWDSLTLGKAHGIANLPGLPLGQPDPTTPASTIVATYYGSYEQQFSLNVLRPIHVDRVEPTIPDDPASTLRVSAQDGRSWETRMVLNATGTWTNPYVPYIPGIRNFTGTQLHTAQYGQATDFSGQRVVVVGGGLSAVQFLLELEGIAETTWATRRPPNFTAVEFDAGWGLAVERAVRKRTFAGKQPASVVHTTGIPMIPAYLDGLTRGTLLSRGMFNHITPNGVTFGPSNPNTPSRGWDPFPAGTGLDVDAIFWNTGFRAALRHLSPMRLHNKGGILLIDEVTPAVDPRVLLVGYGSTASTVGATRAGRLAGTVAAKKLIQ